MFPAPAIKTAKKRIAPTPISGSLVLTVTPPVASPQKDNSSAAPVQTSEETVQKVETNIAMVPTESAEVQSALSKQTDVLSSDNKRKNKPANASTSVPKAQKPLDFFFKNCAGAKSQSANIKSSNVHSLLTPERNRGQPAVSNGDLLSPLDLTDDAFERLVACDNGTPHVDKAREHASISNNELSPNRLLHDNNEDEELFPDNLFLGSPVS